MDQLPGFVAQRENDEVCCFCKFLYGLKQSSFAWFGKFSKALDQFEMKKSKSDHSVFYQRSMCGIIVLVVYVDDIVITGRKYIVSQIFPPKSISHKRFRSAEVLFGH